MKKVILYEIRLSDFVRLKGDIIKSGLKLATVMSNNFTNKTITWGTPSKNGSYPQDGIICRIEFDTPERYAFDIEQLINPFTKKFIIQ